MPVAAPRPVLSAFDAIALTVGIVVGAGIFKTPALVAAATGSEGLALLAWLAGGLVSLVGALCYAELVTAWPHTGGEYHFLRRAYGPGTGFLFAWTRLTVMQTGSIALLGFVFGDYANRLWSLGPDGPALYAAAAVVGFTALNVLGLRSSRLAQALLTVATVLGLVAMALLGLAAEGTLAAPVAATDAPASSLGLAMVFVLLTYGGWNEAAYVSAEMRDRRRSLARALLASLALITLLYLLVNYALLRTLGVQGLAASSAPASALMEAVLGPAGAVAVSALVAVVALASLNVTILTGARSNYALARDFRLFGWLGRWQQGREAPLNALLAQGAIALLLVGLGSLGRDGFETLVEYVSPVFWLFFLLTGASLFVLRRREPGRERPFQVPFYPLTPLLFCLSCAALLYSSLRYTGAGALVGVLVLLAGLPLLWLAGRLQPPMPLSSPSEAKEEP